MLLQGRVLYLDGLLSEAADLLAQAANRMPRDPRPLRYLGLVQAERGESELAVVSFGAALKIDENSAETWNNYGFMLLSLRRYDDAAEALQTAVTQDTTSARYRTNLGFALAGAGNPADALNTFRSVGSEADAQSNLALAYELAGATDEAMLHYSKALSSNPSHSPARQAMERLHLSTPPSQAGVPEDP
jgi:tetratricopeptide (TPR) repeat protein